MQLKLVVWFALVSFFVNINSYNKTHIYNVSVNVYINLISILSGAALCTLFSIQLNTVADTQDITRKCQAGNCLNTFQLNRFFACLITACPFSQLPAIRGFGFPLLSGGMDEQAGTGPLIKHGLSIVQALMVQWLGLLG